VSEQQPRPGGDADATAQRSADRLALALEEVGFDVGVAFPMLGGGVDRHGGPGVELGRVTASVADRLSAVLSQAARQGVSAPAGGDWPDAAGPAARHDPGAGN
jgi:hypothetical protein